MELVLNAHVFVLKEVLLMRELKYIKFFTIMAFQKKMDDPKYVESLESMLPITELFNPVIAAVKVSGPDPDDLTMEEYIALIKDPKLMAPIMKSMGKMAEMIPPAGPPQEKKP